MTSTNESTGVVQPGDRVRAIFDGLTIGTGGGPLGGAGLTLSRGQTFVVTDALIEASRDRYGTLGWPAIVHDPDAQVAMWGRVMLSPADDVTEDLSIAEPGSPEWFEQRETARRRAWSFQDPEERARARAEVERRFGAAPITSSTTWNDPEEKARIEATQRAKERGQR